MTKGVIIPAFNSITSDGKLVDYVRLATINAKLVKRNMNVPVAIMTDVAPDTDVFDEVILVDSPSGSSRTVSDNEGSIKFEWKNDVRINAYDLSPFDRSIMIDADYLILDKSLVPYFETDIPYYMPDFMRDVSTDRLVTIDPNWGATKSIPFKWATVLYFGKGSSALFDAAKIVRDHYPYYANLLGFSPSQFRNDFVFTIANWIISPRRSWKSSINATPPGVEVASVSKHQDKTRIYFRVTADNSEFWTTRNIHIMSKKLVTTPQHLDILEQL